MPMYDYRCDECGSIYDVFHKVREVEEDILCPRCGSVKHTRLLSAPNVSMKGARPAYSAPGSCDTGGGCCGGSCDLN